MKSLRYIFPFVLLALLSGSVADAQVVLQTETFDDDISGWTLETNSPGFAMSLDPAVGSPLPGSLQLTTSTRFADPVLAEALGPCIPTVAGEFVEMDAMVITDCQRC